MAMFRGSKRDADSMQGDDRDRLLNRFRQIIRDENKVIVDSFEKCFVAMETRQAQLESRVEELERKLGRNPGAFAQQAENFAPEIVEVKGFCSWDERLAKGATRSHAEQLMALLIPLLPDQLKPRVKPFQLRGLRNYSIKIRIESSIIREVKGIWSDQLKSGTVHGPGNKELYVTLQKSPTQRTRYAAMGKLYEFARTTHIKESGNLRVLWAPDFSIYLEPNQGAAMLIAHLDVGNTAVWTDQCLQALGFSADEASQKLAEFQRM